MRIVHVCLSNFFVDGRLYQENELVREHHASGHDVLVVASTESHSVEGRVVYLSPGDYVGEEGVRIIRLPYHPWLPLKFARKLRVHGGVETLLSSFRPDVVMFHGLCGWEILSVARFAKGHPEVLLYADSHSDQNNSARTFVSREGLHRLYYRPLLHRALPHIRKVLCISTEAIDFVSSVYGVKQDKIEFFPLGGHPVPEASYEVRRRAARTLYGFDDDLVVFVQAGKQTVRKKLLESLRAFAAVPDPRFRLLIVGSLFEDIRSEARRLISRDPRVRFVGWKSSAELSELLCAADVYLQPGTQSVTMQHSLCARCAVIIDDVPSHQTYYSGNGWLLNDGQSLEDVLLEISNDATDIGSMQDASYRIAVRILDYSVLAERVLR